MKEIKNLDELRIGDVLDITIRNNGHHFYGYVIKDKIDIDDIYLDGYYTVEDIIPIDGIPATDIFSIKPGYNHIENYVIRRVPKQEIKEVMKGKYVSYSKEYFKAKEKINYLAEAIKFYD